MLKQKRLESSSRPPIEHDIRQWLKHRQEVLIHYSQLCSNSESQTEKVLEVFCQLLLDYISFGHFKMFERLALFHQFNQPGSEGLDVNLLNKISLTTDVALNFNDIYTNPKSLENLLQDLSYLGESLASRMDWEDRLIKTYSPFQI